VATATPGASAVGLESQQERDFWTEEEHNRLMQALGSQQGQPDFLHLASQLPGKSTPQVMQHLQLYLAALQHAQQLGRQMGAEVTSLTASDMYTSLGLHREYQGFLLRRQLLQHQLLLQQQAAAAVHTHTPSRLVVEQQTHA
jgi:hypothetical protein